MDLLLLSSLLIILFLLISLIFIYFKNQNNVQKLILENKQKSEEQLKLIEDLAYQKGQLQVINSRHDLLLADIESKNQQIVVLQAESIKLNENFIQSQAQLKDVELIKKSLTQEFENLSHKIFQEKNNHFQKENLQQMDLFLRPFKDKLGEFQQVVHKYREDEMKETASLKNELNIIFKLNKKLSEEAENLTKALKGDNKTQGNWGELILERILESSGLREGAEYTLQAKDLNLVDIEGRVQRPDVIIHLPQEKHIILDSKVSLISYDRFLSATEDNSQIFLKEFNLSLKSHIKNLSEKKYQQLDKILSPDFVLLFIPIEGAFHLAIQNDQDLFAFAWDRKIILVSPTTLMVTLRTIESIWKQEKQNKNAIEMGRLAGDLYDKFCGLYDDLGQVKKSMDKTQELFQATFNKLGSGRGNLIGRLEKIKELGAKTNKSLDAPFDEILS